jgi:cytochrome P450
LKPHTFREGAFLEECVVSVSELARTSALGERPPAPIPNEKPLGPLPFLLRFWRNPLATWTRFNFEWPITQADGVLGRVAVVCEPNAIRRVLIDNVANYRKDALQLRVLSPGLGDGLLTAEGADWRKQRRALAPLFTPRMVEVFTPAMIASAQWLMERWSPLRSGRRIDIAGEMSMAALEVLQRTIFPTGLARDPRDYVRALTDFVNSVGRLHPFDLIGAPEWLPRLGKQSAIPPLKFFNEAVDDIIAKRRAGEVNAQSASGGAPRDLLTMLLDARDPQTGEGLTEEEIRANIITFIAAGHETTANALTWSLFLLSRHPAWRDEVESEVDAVLGERPIEAAQIESLPRVRATLDEAMRLYPPAPSLSREAIAADTLAGEKIQAGTLVVIPPYVLHRHKTLWRDPDHFDPTRFMPGQREAIDRFAYLPFGAGPRTCIGMGFALQEAVIFLATIVKNYRFDLAPGHRVAPVQRLTLRPKGGMPMILKRRAN